MSLNRRSEDQANPCESRWDTFNLRQLHSRQPYHLRDDYGGCMWSRLDIHSQSRERNLDWATIEELSAHGAGFGGLAKMRDVVHLGGRCYLLLPIAGQEKFACCRFALVSEHVFVDCGRSPLW